MKLFQISIAHLIFNILCLTNIFCKSRKKANYTIEENKKEKKDDISLIYNWTKQNNIYINDKLILNKNKDNDIFHNFYYFTANKTIDNNTLLFRIPSNMILTKNSLNEYNKKARNKKYRNLWDKILNLNNTYIRHNSIRQLFFISLVILQSTINEKGNLYKKYKEYFNMYEYINLDRFPIFYLENEILFLSNSNFGKELDNNIRSLNNEFYIVKNILGLEKITVDDFLKLRTITLSNSINYNNNTLIIPLLDCFNKKIMNSSKNINARFIFYKNERGSYDFKIYANKNIEINEEIYLLWNSLPNSQSLLYYGFIDEENLLSSTYYVKFINKEFRMHLNFEENINKSQILHYFKQKNTYDLNYEFFKNYTAYTYVDIYRFFAKYNKAELGACKMMRDNLYYYLKIYEEKYTDALINQNINGIMKKRNIKNILNIEKRLIQNRIKYLNDIIDHYFESKEEREAVEKIHQYEKSMN